MNKTLLRLLGLTLFGLSTVLHAHMQVIQLKHRPANDLLPLISPMLAADERVAGQGQQLILRADSERLRELVSLLEQLDTPLRRLLITLDDSSQHIGSGQDIQARARIKTGQGQIVLGNPGRGDNQVSIRRYSTGGSNQGLRSVQTLEGQAAYVGSGQLIRQQQIDYDHRGRPYTYNQDRELDQGFYVVARVQGSQVVLELSASNDRQAPGNSRIINTSSLSTKVSGPLGSWIKLGQLDQNGQTSSNALNENSRNYSTSNNNLRIKVEVID